MTAFYSFLPDIDPYRQRRHRVDTPDGRWRDFPSEEEARAFAAGWDAAMEALALEEAASG